MDKRRIEILPKTSKWTREGVSVPFKIPNQGVTRNSVSFRDLGDFDNGVLSFINKWSSIRGGEYENQHILRAPMSPAISFRHPGLSLRKLSDLIMENSS